MLAQLLDRGDLADWRELYRLAAEDASLRRRIVRVCTTVPIATPHLFIAAMTALGEPAEPYPEPRADATGSEADRSVGARCTSSSTMRGARAVVNDNHFMA